MSHSRETRLSAAVELTQIPGIGSLLQSRLWSSYEQLEEVFALDEGSLGMLGLAPEAVSAVRSRRYRPIAEELLDWSKREQCHVMVRGDPEYPDLLSEIHDPPTVLYARGELGVIASPAVAVVGTRKPTYYGLQIAHGLSVDLGQRGITIVSGLARGIDAAAHRGALESGARTIAVLGCGVDLVYPREHRHLQESIQKSGLVLSEFPPGTPPSPQNFPVRNRIISGLALGTLIVEAAEYSGSLITARLAMEQNREVFALPGNVTAPQSFGPNFLIKQGAKLVQCWRDVVEELPAELRREILAKEDTSGKGSKEPQLALLTGEEVRVLDLIDMDRATPFDKIYLGCGLEIPHLSDLLFKLEMGGWVRQVPGNLYIRVPLPPNK